MNSTCDTGLGCLLDIQQDDGGWAYRAHSSWTEPTCYSIMALRTANGPENATRRAVEWLARQQRRDGGWSPGPQVEKSTHVTGLAVLALSGMPGNEDIADRGASWLVTQFGAESSVLSRLARVAMGIRSDAADRDGWPWYPGAAAWVIPTSLAICALSLYKSETHKSGKYAGEVDRSEVTARIARARRFLLSRRCPDHGWNHGGLFRADEAPASYPETTGLALLALSGTNVDLQRSLARAEQHARDPQSSEATSWLRLGLLAHGRSPAPSRVRYREWTATQVALRIIAQSGEAGRNPFIDHA